ncbi:hypothetical protein AFA91_29610 [Mycolicibacterium goodii]|uniref:Uncharacterized protein n=2 Tax=Mycolicibacterium goodii TaxID=134601 RepID=A0A0K0XDD9_MYCGD|nr:hypothetical protein AFA91_29610 [Mycolicibacterium goodii]
MMDEKSWPETGNLAISEVIDELNYWRRIQRHLGLIEYDEPDSDGKRLYFRSGYQEGLDWKHWRQYGEWSAYIIESTNDGCYLVKHSTKGERSADRVERVQAVFTRFDDAGKYIVGRMGNAVRVDLGMESVIVRWEHDGADPRLKIEDPTADQLRFMSDVCAGIKPGTFERHLRRFSLVADPEIYALPVPSQIPMMNVIPLELEDLRLILTKGLQLTTFEK